MKEFIEKLIGRLEERLVWHQKYGDSNGYTFAGYEGAISIVNELAEDSSAFRVPLERGGCCEWKQRDMFIRNPHTGRIFSNEPSMKNCYCNTCGKKIKVVE